LGYRLLHGRLRLCARGDGGRTNQAARGGYRRCSAAGRRSASAQRRSGTGYHIHASDGEIGHVEDFLVEDADWSIHYLVVDTKNWWPGKKVLISPRSTRDIDWMDRLVNLDVDRQRVKDSPAYDASTPVDRAYEKDFHKHYGEVQPSNRPPSR
jgi:hypothetical protein